MYQIKLLNSIFFFDSWNASFAIEFYSKKRKISKIPEEEEEGEGDEEDEGETNEDNASSDTTGKEAEQIDNKTEQKQFQQRNTELVLFEHILRLCSLEFSEKQNHWELYDEKPMLQLRYLLYIS